jgi:hypothetical protein
MEGGVGGGCDRYGEWHGLCNVLEDVNMTLPSFKNMSTGFFMFLETYEKVMMTCEDVKCRRWPNMELI